MHTLNSNALLEDLLFRCYHIYNINLTKGMKEMVNKLEQLSQTAISDLLLKLEAKLDADVFTYYGEIVNGVEREVKDFIEALAKDSHKHDSIYIFLTTPGGSLTPVQRMVDIFRHFYDEVNFIVPDYAYSAGTIWCMSGDNIYMNYYSTLGPIDPQVPNKEGHLVAALGYLDKINELLDKAKRNELTQAEFLILKDFDLAELRSYEQAKELAIDMLKKWLTTYKFKDWTIHSDGSAVTQEEKEQRALEIASKLSDNNVWKSHGRPIGIQVLKNDLHLEIVDFEKDSELNEIINNPSTADAAKVEASNIKVEMVKNSDTELKIENLLLAKGYDQAIVFIDSDKVNVVVNMEEITQNDATKIFDIVSNQSGINRENIKLTNNR